METGKRTPYLRINHTLSQHIRSMQVPPPPNPFYRERVNLCQHTTHYVMHTAYTEFDDISAFRILSLPCSSTECDEVSEAKRSLTFLCSLNTFR